MADKRKIGLFLLVLLYTAALLFLKYYFNGLSIRDFSLLKFGNLIDLFPLLVIFLGLNLKRNEVLTSTLRPLYYQLFLAFFFLFLFFFFREKLILTNAYLFGYSLNRILSLLFLIFSFGLVLSVGFFLVLKKPSFIRVVSAVLVFALVLLTFSVLLNIKTQLKDEYDYPKEKFDIGIILGAAVWRKNAPSSILRHRIEKAIELYRKGKIRKIQVTGSNAPGEMSEAFVSKKFLLHHGIPRKAILFENRTHSTIEQIRFIKEKFGEEKRIAIISDPFHLERIEEMSNFFNLKVNGISSESKLNWRKLIYYALRDSIALILFGCLPCKF